MYPGSDGPQHTLPIYTENGAHQVFFIPIIFTISLEVFGENHNNNYTPISFHNNHAGYNDQFMQTFYAFYNNLQPLVL